MTEFERSVLQSGGVKFRTVFFFSFYIRCIYDFSFQMFSNKARESRERNSFEQFYLFRMWIVIIG